MARRSNYGFEKRQREMRKQQKKREKEEKRRLKKEGAAGNYLEGEAGDGTTVEPAEDVELDR